MQKRASSLENKSFHVYSLKITTETMFSQQSKVIWKIQKLDRCLWFNRLDITEIVAPFVEQRTRSCCQICLVFFSLAHDPWPQQLASQLPCNAISVSTRGGTIVSNSEKGFENVRLCHEQMFLFVLFFHKFSKSKTQLSARWTYELRTFFSSLFLQVSLGFLTSVKPGYFLSFSFPERNQHFCCAQFHTSLKLNTNFWIGLHVNVPLLLRLPFRRSCFPVCASMSACSSLSSQSAAPASCLWASCWAKRAMSWGSVGLPSSSRAITFPWKGHCRTRLFVTFVFNSTAGVRLNVLDLTVRTQQTFTRSILGQSLPFGITALHFHLTGTNFPSKFITLVFMDSNAFCNVEMVTSWNRDICDTEQTTRNTRGHQQRYPELPQFTPTITQVCSPRLRHPPRPLLAPTLSGPTRIWSREAKATQSWRITASQPT